jgi:hypothetical protein
MKKNLLTTLALGISLFTGAQTLTLSGRIVTAENKPVPDAIVQLHAASDSTLIKNEFTSAVITPLRRLNRATTSCR